MVSTRTAKNMIRIDTGAASKPSSGDSCNGLSASTQTHLVADIVVTAAQNSQKINRQEPNSIAQLRLSNMQLHGRDDDIKLLRSKLRELAKKNDDKEDAAAPTNNERHAESTNKSISNHLILVSGKSGTGKSSLIHKGLGDNAAKSGRAFASGKFDEKLFRPLSAFSDAMTNLAKHIIAEHNMLGGISSSGSGRLSIATLIRCKIRDEFDEEDVEQLRRVLPGCADLLGKRKLSLLSKSSKADADTDEAALMESAPVSRMGSLSSLAGKESVSQLHFAIRRVLRIICSYLKGVILFIDDLQWSDAATLDLLKSIVLDGEIPSLLIVGAYREDEVPEHHPLAYHVRDLEQMNVSITKIKIGNLSVDNVVPLVAEALRMDHNDNKVKSLAETIYEKTEGNPFFVLMFLRSLHDEKLLQYNFGTMKWTWDDDAVKSRIAAENVSSVLINQMSRLQEETQNALMLASCLGANFRLSAVIEIMKNISRVEMRSAIREPAFSVSGATATTESSTLLSSGINVFSTAEAADVGGSDSSYAASIEDLEEEGLCEVDDEEFHFMHDQIRSAAFELICPDQRDSFRGKIGRIMLQSLSSEELEASFFEVVGLLNYAASKMTDSDLDDLASMNLKAGIKASENAAFDAATIYFQAGREALGSRGWEGNHNIMLDLCSHGANAFYVTGDLDLMNELIEEVLSKDIDTKEKYRVSDIKVRSLFSTGKHNESIDAALNFRRQLGLPTLQKKPASNFTIIREYFRLKRLLKNKTADDIANLPVLDDEIYEMGQRMNFYIITPIYNVEPTMLPLIIFQLVTTSLKHGLNPSSSPEFASLGTLLCGPFGKPHEGLEMVKAAELIIERPGNVGNAETIFVAQYFCYHWLSPLQDTISLLLKGYEIGLKTGENERAAFCLFGRGYHLYFIGRPLDSIHKELEVTVSVLTYLKQDVVKLYSILLLTTVKKLRDIDAGSADEILESVLATAASTDNIPLPAYINVMKLEVFVILQQWIEALDLVRKAGNVRLILSCTFASVRYTFLEALTYLKAAQSASGWKKRQLKKCARKTIQIIRGWAKSDNVNVFHYLYILEAELAVLNGKNKKAEEKFTAAIAASNRIGFLQDKALAHELACSHFKAQGNGYRSSYHVERSRVHYEEWGCSKKVE